MSSARRIKPKFTFRGKINSNPGDNVSDDDDAFLTMPEPSRSLSLDPNAGERDKVISRQRPSLQNTSKRKFASKPKLRKSKKSFFVKSIRFSFFFSIFFKFLKHEKDPLQTMSLNSKKTISARQSRMFKFLQKNQMKNLKKHLKSKISPFSTFLKFPYATCRR